MMNVECRAVVGDMEALGHRLGALSRDGGLNAWQAGMVRHIGEIVDRLSRVLAAILEGQHG